MQEVCQFVAKEQSRNSEYDVRFYFNPSLFCGMTLLQAVFVYTYYGNNFVCINVSFCFQVRQDAAPARNEVGKLSIYIVRALWHQYRMAIFYNDMIFSCASDRHCS
jgi:hypothetical protein